MITLMKLERSLSSKQLVRSCAAAGCPTQPCKRKPSATRAPSGPATEVTRRGGSGPGRAVEQSQGGWDGPPRGGGLSEPWTVDFWSRAASQDT